MLGTIGIGGGRPLSPRLEIDVMNAPSRLLATKQLPLRGAERGTGAVGRGRELGRQLNLDRRLCLAEIQFEVARARYTPTRRDTPGETATATLNELNVVRAEEEGCLPCCGY